MTNNMVYSGVPLATGFRSYAVRRVHLQGLVRKRGLRLRSRDRSRDGKSLRCHINQSKMARLWIPLVALKTAWFV